jgi:16S rRNA processing protein RimM
MDSAGTKPTTAIVRPERTGQSTIEVGLVVKPHGVRGVVKVHLHNPGSNALERARSVVLLAAGEERQVAAKPVGRVGEAVLLELDGVSDREGADRLRGARVLVARADLEPLGEDEYLWEDLIGCRVEGEDGLGLGSVSEVQSAGGADVLVVRDGRIERMIPFVDEWIRAVDLQARRIQVTGEWEPTED